MAAYLIFFTFVKNFFGMKKIILLVLTSFVCLSLEAIEPIFKHMDWKMLVCDIIKQTTSHKKRSAIYVPEVYQSEDYLSVQSEYVNYENVHITITDEQGRIVKNDVIQVVAGGENLYYIGDLESGCFEITIEFDDFILCGNLYSE